MDRPPRSLPEANEDFSGKPAPYPDDGKLDLTFYEPKSVLIGGKEAVPAPVVVDAGKSAAVVAVFETDPATWGTRNVMTICGGLRYLSGDGREGHGHGRLSLQTRPRREHVASRRADRLALIQNT